MSCCTNAVFTSEVTVGQVHAAILAKYKNVSLHELREHYHIDFDDGNDKRIMFVSLSQEFCELTENFGLWCSLGGWGNSLQIMQYLCSVFGGAIDENDCDDKGYCHYSKQKTHDK